MSCKPPGRTADGVLPAVNDPNWASGTVLESAVPRRLPNPVAKAVACATARNNTIHSPYWYWRGGGGRARTKTLGTSCQQAKPRRFCCKRPRPQPLSAALGDRIHSHRSWRRAQSTQSAGRRLGLHLQTSTWAHRGAAALGGVTLAAGATVCCGSANGAAALSGSSKSGLSAAGFFPKLDPVWGKTSRFLPRLTRFCVRKKRHRTTSWLVWSSGHRGNAWQATPRGRKGAHAAKASLCRGLGL